MATASECTAVESSFSEEVAKLLGQGKRHLVCSEVEQAVKSFEEATQKLDSKYGSGSVECGEAYLFYGKALLELARSETGVLGSEIKDADVDPKSEESSDDDDDDEEQIKMGVVGPKISQMSPGSKQKIRDDVQDAMFADEETADDEEKDKEGNDKDKNKNDEQDKGEEATNENKTESKTKSEDATAKENKAVEEKKGEEGKKESEVEEQKGKDEGKKGKEEGKKGEGKGKKGKEEGNKGEGKGKKSKEEGKKGEEEGKEGEVKDIEGEDEEMEGDEEEMEGNDDEEMEGDDEEMEGGNEGGGEADGGQGGDNAAIATAEGQEEDGDVPTMQLAWEFLELARIVFLGQDKEAQLNLAEVYLKLGEIQLEQEQFVNAAEEFQKCLDLQQKHLEPDDRLIAETAYSMGLAYSLQPNYSKAKDFFSKALDVIKLRTDKLEARLAESDSKSKGKGKATADNPCVVDRKELQELQNLYPEIKARVDDAQEMINSASNQPESTTEEGFGTSGQGNSDVPASTIPVKQAAATLIQVRRKAESTTEVGFGTSGQDKSDVPASTIPVKPVANLIPVRRKRKPDDESSSAAVQDTEAPVKKARQDNDQPTAPVITENGHAPNKGVTSTEQT